MGHYGGMPIVIMKLDMSSGQKLPQILTKFF